MQEPIDARYRVIRGGARREPAIRWWRLFWFIVIVLGLYFERQFLSAWLNAHVHLISG